MMSGWRNLPLLGNNQLVENVTFGYECFSTVLSPELLLSGLEEPSKIVLLEYSGWKVNEDRVLE